jgi:hypothetical protein
MTVRRLKTYTGGQGYVYQYYFVGSRRSLPTRSKAASTEYIFDVTSDRKTTFAISVFLGDEAVAGWAASHDRTLSDAERYAAVKVRLFQAFDEIEDLRRDGRELIIDIATLEHAMAALGVE